MEYPPSILRVLSKTFKIILTRCYVKKNNNVGMDLKTIYAVGGMLS